MICGDGKKNSGCRFGEGGWGFIERGTRKFFWFFVDILYLDWSGVYFGYTLM